MSSGAWSCQADDALREFCGVIRHPQQLLRDAILSRKQLQSGQTRVPDAVFTENVCSAAVGTFAKKRDGR